MPPTDKPSSANPLGYDIINNYENYLLSLLTGTGVQRDIVYDLILKYISKDFSNTWKSETKPYSKMEIRHLISEINLIAKIYVMFLKE